MLKLTRFTWLDNHHGRLLRVLEENYPEVADLQVGDHVWAASVVWVVTAHHRSSRVLSGEDGLAVEKPQHDLSVIPLRRAEVTEEEMRGGPCSICGRSHLTLISEQLSVSTACPEGMKLFELVTFEEHQIPGRGTVFAFSMKENPGMEGVRVGDLVDAGGTRWEVTGIEGSTNLTHPPRPGVWWGLVVRAQDRQPKSTMPSAFGGPRREEGKPQRPPTTQERVNWQAKHVVGMLKGHELTELPRAAVDKLEEELEQLRKEKVAGG